jgi:probable phosphoglycerate mutase
VATTFYLVRHAAHPLVDRVLMGRTDGVLLTCEGRAQAERLTNHFGARHLDGVQSSPRGRARQTAEPVATRMNLPIAVTGGLDEIDYGEWSGRSFNSLQDDPRWSAWNTARGSARAPRGESMAELQVRVIAYLDGLRRQHPDGRFLLVSHAETIRAALLHYLGRPLDAFATIEVAPASVSTVRADGSAAEVMCVNERAGL